MKFRHLNEVGACRTARHAQHSGHCSQALRRRFASFCAPSLAHACFSPSAGARAEAKEPAGACRDGRRAQDGQRAQPIPAAPGAAAAGIETGAAAAWSPSISMPFFHARHAAHGSPFFLPHLQLELEYQSERQQMEMHHLNQNHTRVGARNGGQRQQARSHTPLSHRAWSPPIIRRQTACRSGRRRRARPTTEK